MRETIPSFFKFKETRFGLVIDYDSPTLSHTPGYSRVPAPVEMIGACRVYIILSPALHFKQNLSIIFLLFAITTSLISFFLAEPKLPKQACQPLRPSMLRSMFWSFSLNSTTSHWNRKLLCPLQRKEKSSQQKYWVI